jgi:protein subunit release factor B
MDTIPKSETEVTMSRSSGPGGQNVNKCVLATLLSSYHTLLVGEALQS